ncbi:hypothetical protein [Acholeplasma laidlawii]|uniref:hypothetical protein n=1 Tax=Acholeplasma laidlawii TaxID=2148 RepID=UPI0021F7DB38|nr:hypothetical protein [Acholeplasma laidlawii]
MKKISLLVLVVISFLFVGMMIPNVHAAEVDVTINLNVITKDINGDAVFTSTDFTVPFGNTTSMDLSGISLKEGESAILVQDDQFIHAETKLVMSRSLNLSVIIKETVDYVAVFVDTNGELVDVQYNPQGIPTYSGLALTKPNYVFAGFNISEITTDTIFVANYTLSPESVVSVQIDTGTPVEHNFNDRVTVSSELEGFTHWEDEDGNVVSYKNPFTFSAIEDITLTPKTNGTPQSNIYMRDVTGIRTSHSSFYGYVEYDEALYTLVEYGFLGGLTNDILMMDNIQYIPSNAKVNNEFLRSIESSDLLYKTTAYAVLKNRLDSTMTTIYSGNKQVYDLTFNFTVPTDTADTIYMVGGFTGTSWNPVNALAITKASDVYQKNIKFIAEPGEILSYKMIEYKSFDYEANYIGTDNSDRTYTFASNLSDTVNINVVSWRGVLDIYFGVYAEWSGVFRIHYWGTNVSNPSDGTNWPHNLPVLNKIASSPDVYKHTIHLFNSRDLTGIYLKFKETTGGNAESQNFLYDSSVGNYFKLTGWSSEIGMVIEVTQYPVS